MAKPKPRLQEIQYLRGFAFLAVVLQHAIGHYVLEPDVKLEDGVLMGVLLLLSKFAVPLFIFITGLVLFYNYESGVRFLPFLRKRFKDIVLPYLPWALIYAFLGGTLPNSWESLRQLGLALITGTVSYHLWYVAMIIQFYFWFPALHKGIYRLKLGLTPKSGLAVLIALGVFYVWYTGVRGTFSDAVGRLPIPIVSDLFTTYSDRNAIHYFYYFLMGAAAGMYIERWQSFLSAYRCLIRIVYAVMLGVLLYATVSRFQLSPKLAIQYNATFLVQPLMASFLIAAVLAMHSEALRFSSLAPQRLKAVLDRIGTLSYTAYLAHALVLIGAVWCVDHALPGANVAIRAILSFSLCAAGSSVLAAMLRNMKHRYSSWQTQKKLSAG